jgi:hypothetical protein
MLHQSLSIVVGAKVIHLEIGIEVAEKAHVKGTLAINFRL